MKQDPTYYDDQIIKDAGGLWGEPGCSMCNAVNGDELKQGQVAVSTTNRNFNTFCSKA